MSKSSLVSVSLIFILELTFVVLATNSFTKTCYAPDGTPSSADFLPCIMVGNVDSSKFLCYTSLHLYLLTIISV